MCGFGLLLKRILLLNYKSYCFVVEKDEEEDVSTEVFSTLLYSTSLRNLETEIQAKKEEKGFASTDWEEAVILALWEALLRRRGPSHFDILARSSSSETATPFTRLCSRSALSTRSMNGKTNSNESCNTNAKNDLNTSNDLNHNNYYDDDDDYATLTDTQAQPSSMLFLGSVLHIRGATTTPQPCLDAAGNLLVFNGELLNEEYRGLSDTLALSERFRRVC
jgi:hypothetical protein